MLTFFLKNRTNWDHQYLLFCRVCKCIIHKSLKGLVPLIGAAYEYIYIEKQISSTEVYLPLFYARKEK